MKTKIKLRWIWITQILWLVAWSHEPTFAGFDDFVVKVWSRNCKTAEAIHEGSGFTFSHEGGVYVLTSEHVLIHGLANPRFCHGVQNTVGAESSARLLAADWGTGLALLEVPALQMEARKFPQLEKLFSDESVRGSEVVVMGYPYHENQLVIDNRGVILLPASSRHLLPGIKSIIEIQGAHGEFGMSGGPVLSRQTNQVMGMLSDQYLKWVPGGPSEVRIFQANAKNNQEDRILINHLLAIPAIVIQSWLKRFFDSPSSFHPGFLRNPLLQEIQEQGETAVITSGFQFLTVPFLAGQSDRRGKNPTILAARGGADGGGIGGNGGNELARMQGDHSISVRPISIRMEYLARNNSANWENQRFKAWMDKALVQLPAGKVFYIHSLVKTELKTFDVIQVNFRSLEEFFRKIEEGYLPVATSPEGSPSELFTKLGQVLKLNYEKILDAPLEAHVLLRRVLRISEILASKNGRFLDPRVLEAVEADQEGWSALFNSSRFDEATELLASLRKARNELQKAQKTLTEYSN